MAIRYIDHKNKYQSGYIVSGKQARMVRCAIVEKNPEDSRNSIKRTTRSIKAILAKVDNQ